MSQPRTNAPRIVVVGSINEAQQLTGLDISDLPQAELAAKVLRGRGPRNIVLKLGQRGALISDQRDRCRLLAAFPVKAKDSTAAGNAFNAALAFALCQSDDGDLAAAARFACAARRCAASQMGAQPSLPTMRQVEAILAEN